MKFSDRKENVRLTNSLIGINNHSHFRQSFPHSLVNRIWKRIDFRAQSIIGEGGRECASIDDVNMSVVCQGLTQFMTHILMVLL